MQSKILSKLILRIVIVAGFVFSLAFISYFILGDSIQSDLAMTKNTVVPSKLKSVSYGLPVRLKIPSIKVDAAVKSVGLTPQGAMGVPTGPIDVVWFNLGPRPGEEGGAVIAGHYGRWKNGTLAIFNNLYKLRQGDKLYIKDDKGMTISFVVRESRSYDPSMDASDVFGLNDGKAHLNLVTCEGIWNSVSKSYSKRLVVFTDKE